MLADYLVDNASGDKLINKIISKCVRREGLNGVKLGIVMEKLLPAYPLIKFCVNFAVRHGAKEGKMPDNIPGTLQAKLAGRMFELAGANAQRSFGHVFGCKTNRKLFAYCTYHKHIAGKSTSKCDAETDKM